MAQNQIRFSLGLALAQVLISILGTNRTGKTGAEKKASVVDSIEPLINFGAEAAENNTANAMSKEEIGLGVQAVHDALLTSGLIHDTAALEAGTAPVATAAAPQINVTTTLPAPAPITPVPEQAKYLQWLRLATPGLMPANETLRANLYVAGDALYNDGDASNAPEFYFVAHEALPAAPPNSPTGRIAKFAGHVG